MKNLLDTLRMRKSWIIEMLVFAAVFAAFTGLLFCKFMDRRMMVVEEGGFDTWMLFIGVGFSTLPVFFMLFQAVLVCFYKPVAAWPENRPLPGCTVIVPAYNEGCHVAETMRSLLKSDYPREKLEIIAINDGSVDDTWSWIKLVAAESNGLIHPINLAVNGGKKHALYQGFHEAKHEIVITIDSDSIVQSDTIRNLIPPFADEKVGGSAGTVRVSNLNEGIVPRMLDICFVFSCDFMRCAQSAIGAVLCSPGAISAYRKSALMPHLDGWLNQKFMGEPSNIGEDRALTSILLCHDYRVVLQNTAMVTTRVPTDYPQLCRTLIRWTRGDVREGLLMARHFGKRFNPVDFRQTALQINLFSQLIGLILPFVILPSTLYLFIACYHNFWFLLYYTVVISWVWAVIPAMLYAQRESPLKAVWAFVYGVFSLFALSWICIYSWVTVRNSKWLTRGSAAGAEMDARADGNLS